MACISKRRGRYVVDFRDQNGKRHWESYRTKKAAQKALGKRTTDVEEKTYFDPAMLPTFAKVAKSWLSVKRDHPASTFNFWRAASRAGVRAAAHRPSDAGGDPDVS